MLTVSVDSLGLREGTYTSSVVISGGNASATVTVTLTIAAAVITAVTEAAGFVPGKVCAGGLVSIFGSGFATIASQATSLPLPVTLAGVYVSFNGILAPIFYVGPGQINVEVPDEVSGATVSVVVQTPNGSTAPFQAILTRATPGVLTLDGSGRGAAIVADSLTGTLVTPAYPIARSGYATVYATGLGPVTAQPPTGLPAAVNPLSGLQDKLTVTLDLIPADVEFAGLVPGFVGLYQINIKIPPIIAASHQADLRVAVNGLTSNLTTIAIQ
jgi:uncharacterized protein (TIGR03437 family)